MGTTYKSGQQAIDAGVITNEEWQEATSHPWVWLVLKDGTKLRELPWQGLEIRFPEDTTVPDFPWVAARITQKGSSL